MAEKKEPQPIVNKVVINLAACAVEVVSNTSSLEEVYAIANEITMKMTGDDIKGKTLEKRIENVGIR